MQRKMIHSEVLCSGLFSQEQKKYRISGWAQYLKKKMLIPSFSILVEKRVPSHVLLGNYVDGVVFKVTLPNLNVLTHSDESDLA